MDPEAALICAHSGANLTWVTSEVTHRIPLLCGARDDLSQTGPLGQALARMIDSWDEGWFRAAMIEGDDLAALPADAVALPHDPLMPTSLFPRSDEWLTMRTVRLRYAIEDGVLRMRDVSDDSDGSARVSTGAVADRVASFCVERIVWYASQSDERLTAGGGSAE